MKKKEMKERTKENMNETMKERTKGIHTDRKKEK